MSAGWTGRIVGPVGRSWGRVRWRVRVWFPDTGWLRVINRRADDRRMGKYLILGVAVAFMGVLRLATVDFSNVSIPFLSPVAAAPGLGESAKSIGTPAAVTLPESDPATWFEAAEGTDPDDPAKWAAIAAFASEAGTPGGWAEACKKVSAVAGSERATKPDLGALSCSSDLTVTQLQRFVVQLLAARAEVTLWLRGVDGHDNGMVSARLSEVRHSCENGLPARLAGESSPYSQACTAALSAAELPLDGEALRAGLIEAYGLVAADLVTRDASIDAEPAAVAESAAATATPSQ